jgi:hypothetical protein
MIWRMGEESMAKSALSAGGGKKREKKFVEPKRLSKLGEWMKAHPRGIGLVIHDMRAVMK